MQLRRGEGTIRRLTERDLNSLVALEERIWGPLGIETVPRGALTAWIESGIFFGCFGYDELLGYAYAERIEFSPFPPYSEELLAALDDYKSPRPRPAGNALHGVSLVSTGMGAGALLLEALIVHAQSEGLNYFVSLARLSGLSRFVTENGERLGGMDLPQTALLYAHQAVSRVDPLLIGPPLQLLSIPDDFPRLTRNDRVLGYFSRIGKELWAIAETSFKDPDSLNFSALLVLSLH